MQRREGGPNAARSKMRVRTLSYDSYRRRIDFQGLRAADYYKGGSEMHPLLRNVVQFVVAGVILALALAAHSPYAKSIATVWESYEQPKLGFSLGSVL